MEHVSADEGNNTADILAGVAVLRETPHYVVLNKPARLMVHPDGRTSTPTLVDWIRARYPECDTVGEPMRLQNGAVITRPGIVHRLDTDTSGIMVIARTKETHAHLKAQFMAHEVEKIYRAFVYGVMKNDHGVIDRPIGRASTKNGPPRWSAQRGARGTLRDAYTSYRVVARGSAHTYVETMPKTGRTHQIRVHLKYIQHPIVCDRLYAPRHPCALGFSRVALHAHTLTFVAVDGTRVTAEAPIPGDFVAAISRL